MTAQVPTEKQFPCKSCGAGLHFAPGTTALTCPYCGTLNQIEGSAERVEELDFEAAVAQLARQEATDEVLTVKCNVCGAESQLGANVTADLCPFCSSPIVATAASRKRIRPRSLLPFHVTREQAQASFRNWLGSLWFAPNDLVKQAYSPDRLRGMYLPAWTYDAGTVSHYTGQRGDDYWVTETYTAYENGKHVTRTRQVRRTRWTFVSGTVTDDFDDVLVMAARSLPQHHMDALEPWDLKNVTPYRDEYLSGFVAQSYQVTLADGFEAARGIMEVTIRQTIAGDIGGDHQQISSVDTRYHGVTFKHILLPVWLSAYRYAGRPYHFLVNARTGEVRGDRPYSPWKIAVALVLAIVVVLIIVLVTQAQQR